jgi:hypothetical protein
MWCKTLDLTQSGNKGGVNEREEAVEVPCYLYAMYDIYDAAHKKRALQYLLHTPSFVA